MRIKNVFVSLMLLALFAITAVFADNKPIFDSSETSNASEVLDINKVKGYAKDNIRLVNFSSYRNISFKVLAYETNTKKWITFGVGTLKGSGDADFLESSRDVKEFRYYVVVPFDNEEYHYEFLKRHNDLYINILN
ncbi:hypothetical protein FACS189479_08230 [Spirochaetia bacterium]|nr:hypothetical protein FACS189479_08230 [Spirochaetia bacterium]